MKKWMKRFSIIGLAVVIVLGVIGAVAAQGPGGADGKGAFGQMGPGGPNGPRDARGQVGKQVFDTVLEVTGLTAEELRTALGDDKTIADVLAEQGVESQTVIDTVTVALTEQINQAVADDKLTEEQAATALENLGEALESALNNPFPNRDRGQDRGQNRLGKTMFEVMAEMAGVEADEFMNEAFAPPSIAEVAAEYGIDQAALLDAVEARITEEVNQALADGEITEEQAAQALDGLSDRLEEHFNSPFHPMGFGGGPGGMHEDGIGGPEGSHHRGGRGGRGR